MAFRTHDDFSFPGTGLRVAFSSLILAGLGRHYYPEQLQTMNLSLVSMLNYKGAKYLSTL